MNRDLLACRPHPSKQISDAIAADPQALNLTVGEPGYGPPARFLDRVAELTRERGEDPAPAYNRYAHSRGLPKLRAAIAGYYRRRYGLEVDPEAELLVTNGGAEALWLTVFTLTNPGDEVVIPDPCYMLFEPIALSLGRHPVRIRTRAENAFRLDPRDLEAQLTPRTRLVMLNSPENPTGTVYDRATLERILELARERGFHVMHDEVFDSIIFRGEHVPARLLDAKNERVVMVNSFSKRFGMTGWRLGWLLAPPDVVAEAAKAHTFQSLATGTLVQEAAAEALADPESDAEVRGHCEALQAKGARFLQSLETIEGFALPVGPPAGGFYAFVDVTGFGRRIGATNGVSDAVVRYLLQHAKVGVVPGNGFGAGGEGYIRISYAAPEAQLEQALERLRRIPLR